MPASVKLKMGERAERQGRNTVAKFNHKNRKNFLPGSKQSLSSLVGMQYMRDMMDGRAALIELSNERYL